VGNFEGVAEGKRVGMGVGEPTLYVGRSVGEAVGAAVGADEGFGVGAPVE